VVGLPPGACRGFEAWAPPGVSLGLCVLQTFEHAKGVLSVAASTKLAESHCFFVCTYLPKVFEVAATKAGWCRVCVFLWIGRLVFLSLAVGVLARAGWWVRGAGMTWVGWGLRWCARRWIAHRVSLRYRSSSSTAGV
jgi:hypothetical protein